jgi:hypothetical protein
MDRTGEHHSEQGYPGSEDQKSYVLPHIQTLDLGQMQQCGYQCVCKGRAHMGDMGIVRKPKT